MNRRPTTLAALGLLAASAVFPAHAPQQGVTDTEIVVETSCR